MRPEVIGFVLGALGAALMFRDFRPRAGSAPIVRFILGVFAMIGALVFLGCPWRALLRLGGGDLNAVTGIAGLATGIWIGTLFFRKGYSLGRAPKAAPTVGLVMPAIMLFLLVVLLASPQIAGEAKSGVLFYSLKGPGAMHAPLIISLAVGLGVGFLAQRSRFCTMGAFRDLILFRQAHLFNGLVALVVAALATNLILGQFKLGFEGQPVAHALHFWNFAGMVLRGSASPWPGAARADSCSWPARVTATQPSSCWA